MNSPRTKDEDEDDFILRSCRCRNYLLARDTHVFISSRHTCISVTSAISLLIGSSLGSMASGDPARFGAMAACTALLTAAIAFLAWLARAGSVVSFVSETVLIGFKAGVALQLASTQLPKLFGVTGGHGNFWERMDVFFHHVGETNATSLMLGCTALGLLMLGKLGPAADYPSRSGDKSELFLLARFC